MNVTLWFLIAFGGTTTPIDIMERFTSEFHCENVRRALRSRAFRNACRRRWRDEKHHA